MAYLAQVWDAANNVWQPLAGTIDTNLAYTWENNQTFNAAIYAPTAPLGTNTTQVATTAFVLANGGGGGGATWGSITGTLSSQTDLQNALNLKADKISEPLSSPSPSGGVLTVDLNVANVAITSGESPGFTTLSIINAPTTNGFATTVTIFVSQAGASGSSVPTSLTINGSDVTGLVKWVDGLAPSASSVVATDAFSFTLLRYGNTWNILASSVLGFRVP